MISINSKFHPCKNPIQTTIHQPLQIRTNKHRCFVFCIGHTSLTCVPGIGKKNEHLLNQSGIYDLSTLYSKYRSINNSQHFKQWLQNEIGFTSYQAKMTTCGIGSKLGDIKEINTGLLPICCSSKEKKKLFSNERNISKRNRSTTSKGGKNKEEGIKKQKIEKIKLVNSTRDQIEHLHTSNKPEALILTSSSSSINNIDVTSSQKNEQSLSSPEEKPSNNYPAHVKSPSMAVKEDSDLSTSSFDQKPKTNKISEARPMNFYPSSMVNETAQDSTDLLDLTKQNSASLDILESKRLTTNSKIDIELSNVFSGMNVELLKSKSHLDHQKTSAIQTKKSSDSHSSGPEQIHLTLSSELPMENKLKLEPSQTSTNVMSHHSISPTDTTTKDQSISSSPISTNNVHLDKQDKMTSHDNSSEFHDTMEKETYRSSSPHTSVKTKDNNKTEQDSPSKEKKPVLHSNFDKSPDLKDNSEEKQESPVDFSTKNHPPSISPLNEKLNEIFALTKQKLQPTLDALQDKKDELLFTSKNSPNSPIEGEYPRKSILRSTQSNSISQLHTDALLAAIKQQQEQTIKTIQSPKTNWIKTAVNYGIDSGIKPASNEGSSNEIDNKSISAIKRSYSSLPLSTPAIFPTKSRSMKKSDVSHSINLSRENNLTTKMNQQMSFDSKLNTNNTTFPSRSSPSTEEEDFKNHQELTFRPITGTNTQTKTSSQLSATSTTTTLSSLRSLLEDKSQEYVFDRFDSSLNESQQTKFREEIRKTISQIMNQAVKISHGDIHPSQTNSKTTYSIQTPMVESNNRNDLAQSIILSPKQEDEYRTTPSKCIPLAEQLVQAKAKKLAIRIQSNDKDVRSLQSSEQGSLTQINLYL